MRFFWYSALVAALRFYLGEFYVTSWCPFATFHPVSKPSSQSWATTRCKQRVQQVAFGIALATADAAGADLCRSTPGHRAAQKGDRVRRGRRASDGGQGCGGAKAGAHGAAGRGGGPPPLASAPGAAAQRGGRARARGPASCGTGRDEVGRPQLRSSPPIHRRMETLRS